MATTRNADASAGPAQASGGGPMPGRVLLKILKWLGIGLLVLILALVLFILWFDLNRLRGPISDYVSGKLNRPFAINGDLRIDWSWTPKLSVGGVELGNAPWASREDMFSLERAEVSVRIPELFKGRLIVPEIRVVKPQVLLEKSESGRANWEFDLPEKDPDEKPFTFPRRWFPKIERLAIEDGRVRFRDPLSATELDMAVSTAMGASDEQGLRMTGRGRIQQERFELTARGGSILSLWEEGKPFPVELKLDYGPTRAEVAGSFAEPLQLEGPALRFEASGPDLAALRPVSPAWIPRTPPYRFAGKVNRKGDKWLIRDFEGKLGGSDLSGDLGFVLRDGRPLLEGDVVSKKLDFRDFAGFIGANPTPKPDEPPRPRLLPVEPYNVEGLRVADADIRFKSSNIVTPMMPVDDVSAHVRLDRGVLTVKPATATIGLGRIVADVNLDATGSTIQTQLGARIDRVPFKRLLAKTPFAEESAGTFVGRVDLAMAGNSVAAMASEADGGITIIMEQGRISELIMELIGIDIAEILFRFVADRDRSMPINCMINDFIVTDGLVKTRLFLLDTADTKVTGEGQVNLGNETINFRLAAHPKDPSIFSARTPVTVRGTLKKPIGWPEVTPLAARGAASVVLGALLTPAAAILPWVELGLEEDSPCRALVDAAKQQEGGLPESGPVRGKGKGGKKRSRN
jgi:uncharacterized protein involved in outer membrane biogenesis